MFPRSRKTPNADILKAACSHRCQPATAFRFRILCSCHLLPVAGLLSFSLHSLNSWVRFEQPARHQAIALRHRVVTALRFIKRSELIAAFLADSAEADRIHFPYAKAAHHVVCFEANDVANCISWIVTHVVHVLGCSRLNHRLMPTARKCLSHWEV